VIFYITQVPCKKCGQVSGCRETMGRTALHNLVSGAGAVVALELMLDYSKI